MFAVEWSTSASFKRILGSPQVLETKNPSYSIKGLTTVSEPVDTHTHTHLQLHAHTLAPDLHTDCVYWAPIVAHCAEPLPIREHLSQSGAALLNQVN